MKEDLYLHFSNLLNKPYVALDTKLTIGSEAGDYLLTEEGISPRHCSFYVENQVITFLDHNSYKGSFLNGVKVSPGKKMILMEGDVIYLGEHIKIELIKKFHAPQTEELSHWDIPPLPNSCEKKAKTQKVRVQKKKPKKKEKKLQLEKIDKKTGTAQVAGAVSRLLALLLDMGLALIFYNLCAPFAFVKKVLSFLKEDLLMSLLSAKPFMLKVLSEFTILVDFAVFMIVYLLCAHGLFAVSLGQKILGIKTLETQFFLKRIKGFIRSLIFVTTGPFLIFDIPALIPRRTFKEKITGSALICKRGLPFAVKFIIAFILIVMGVFLSPLFQGGKLQRSYELQLDQTTKAVERGQGDFNSPKVLSRYFNVLIHKHPHALLVPVEIDKKMAIMFHPLTSADGQEVINKGSIEVSQKSEFPLLAAIREIAKLDPFFYLKFPLLHHYSRSQPSSRMGKNTDGPQIRQELMKLMKIAFELNITNIWGHIIHYGPFIKGYLDFRVKILKQVGELDKVRVKKIGDTYTIIFSRRELGEQDILMPLYLAQDISFIQLRAKHFTHAQIIFPYFYEEMLQQSQWAKYGEEEGRRYFHRELISGFTVLDFIWRLNRELVHLRQEDIENIYQYFFETAKNILSFNRVVMQEDFLQAFALMEKSLKNQPHKKQEEYERELLENLKIMKDHFSNRDYKYFGVQK